VEFASMVYRGREGIEIIMQFVTGPLLVPFFLLQFAIGAMTPLIMLTWMIWRGTTGHMLIAGVTVCAVLVLFSVFMMRWNVVIGGQEISKTGKGLLTYHPLIFTREGILAAASPMIAAFVLLWLAVKLLPPWPHDAAPSSAPSARAR